MGGSCFVETTLPSPCTLCMSSGLSFPPAPPCPTPALTFIVIINIANKQVCPYGLYAEQISGAAFTVPRRCAFARCVLCVVVLTRPAMQQQPATQQQQDQQEQQLERISKSKSNETQTLAAGQRAAQSAPSSPLSPSARPPHPSRQQQTQRQRQRAAPHVALPHPALRHARALPPARLPGRDADRRLCRRRRDAQPAALAAVCDPLGAGRLCARPLHGLRRGQVRARVFRVRMPLGGLMGALLGRRRRARGQ